MFKAGDKVVRKLSLITREFADDCRANRREATDTFEVGAVGDMKLILVGLTKSWSIDYFELATADNQTEVTSDAVSKPSHYQFFEGLEAIEVIASSMSEEGFRGYCLGNRLKYRLRAGNKDKLEQDIAKSDFYVELFDKHKHLCRK